MFRQASQVPGLPSLRKLHKQGKTCTYEKPYIRGHATLLLLPSPDGVTRNISKARDKDGGLICRARGWAVRAVRACDSCRALRCACSRKLPCSVCFINRSQCIYHQRENGIPPPDDADADADAEGDGDSHVHDGAGNSDEEDSIITGNSSAHQANEASWRPTAPGIGPLQLGRRYAGEEKPPVVFIHRAWEKLAQTLRRNHRAGGGRVVDPRPRSSDDQPFEHSAPLQGPNRDQWFHLQREYFNGWNGTFRFLHRPAVASWLDRVEKNASDGADLSRHVGHARAALVLMTMALGTLLLEKEFAHMKRDKKTEWIYTLNSSDQICAASVAPTDAETTSPKLESV
ncbi:hypothetical protein B0H63DRAFT_155648 [Podospora didyma]|uniref:Zn(2)-C6 fungal-type domain-containing protein n=1 Tax=Podospora didyma TaxID=330526 RepID=A0AAE0U192_9PEZI|nr:hypothetical protein B0H63DRAFT_155648 [Podospora didyma]